MSYYTVYKITNLINGKYYIGKHKTDDLNDCYMGSGKMLKRAYNKYGIENFFKEIIYVFDNEKKMNLTEKILVVPDQEINYNLCSGGQGGFDYIIKNGLHFDGTGTKRTDKTKEKMRLNHWSRNGKKQSTLAKYLNSRTYQPHTEERKIHQSKLMKEKFKDSEYLKKHSIINSKKIVVDGIEFNNGRKAALYYNITPSAVTHRLKSNNFPNWNYKKEQNP